MQECTKREKPKMAVKPTIPTKPKYIPPVNVKNQKSNGENERTSSANLSSKPTYIYNFIKGEDAGNDVLLKVTQIEKKELVPKSSDYKKLDVETNTKYDEYSYSYISERCDKYSTTTSFETYKKVEEPTKAPSSPSTVCCSILSNATTDCCGIVPINKKELSSKTMTKIDSMDSNSSDSGGFKDFIQLDSIKKAANGDQVQHRTHQRQLSQQEHSDKSETGSKKFEHQRKYSKPEILADAHQLSHLQNKQNYVANAQALAQFLPQTGQKLLQYKNLISDKSDDTFHQNVAKFSGSVKTDDKKDIGLRQKPQIISQSQFKQSTKKLEELLSQRLEKDIAVRKGASCLIDGESSEDLNQKLIIQKQMQQKLQADLKQTVQQIQEIQSIELRLPQNRKWNEVSTCIFCMFALLLSISFYVQLFFILT